MSPSPTQLAWRGRIEAVLRVAEPALDALLAVGDRVSRVLEPGDADAPPPARRIDVPGTPRRVGPPGRALAHGRAAPPRPSRRRSPGRPPSARRAAVAAVLAGVLTLLGNALQSGVYSGLPKVYAVDALRDAAGLPIPGGQGLRTAQIRFLDGKGTELLLTGLLIAVGAALVAPALGYLFRATRARRPMLPQMALWAVLLGPLLVAVGGLVAQVTLVVQAHQFATGHDFSSQAARDALGGGALLAGQLARQIGILALALGFVLVSLNAMRAGLLTRFMGDPRDPGRRAVRAAARVLAADRAVLLADRARPAAARPLAQRRPAGLDHRGGRAVAQPAGAARAAPGGRTATRRRARRPSRRRTTPGGRAPRPAPRRAPPPRSASASAAETGEPRRRGRGLNAYAPAGKTAGIQ